MPKYRRPKVTGVPVFFTVNLADRSSDLLVQHIDALRDAVRVTQAERPFEIEAWVVLPDHMHCIWRLPHRDRDYGIRWGAIKARFTRTLRAQNAMTNTHRRPGFSPDPPPFPTEFPVITKGRFAGLKPGLRQDKREQAIWQRRFWEHHIRDEADFTAHLRYCWVNPVKHGYVDRVQDWPFSSVHWDERFQAGMDLT